MPIEIMQAGTMNSALVGWEGSRDLDNPPSISEVATLDASVNELPTALFYFRDMMLIERELVVTPRNHVIWARTSRVDNPAAFRAPFSFYSQHHDVIRSDMISAKQAGIPQDQWRMTLPLCSTTSWTARLSWRDAVRMACYFTDVANYIGRENPKLGGRLLNTSLELQDLLPKAFGLPHAVVDSALANFKRIPIGAEVTNVLNRVAFGPMVVLSVPMSFALRAQFVRHREFIIGDNLVHMLNAPHSEQLDMSVKLMVHAAALETTWRAVLGKRTCWMAQSDLWAPLARAFGSTTDGLPCAGGVCPYAEDAKLRVAGKDPGAPCPRYASLSNTPLSQAQFAEAALQAERTSNPEMWRHELEHAPLNGIFTIPIFTIQKPGRIECVHAQGCPTPTVCFNENHCDAKFNGYR